MWIGSKSFLCLVASAALLLGGCSDGKDGASGKDGKDAGATISVAALTPTEWSNLSFDQDSGIIGVPTINSPPVVKFKVTANGKPVTGIPIANMSFAIAKLVPAKDGVPSQWINYNVIAADQKSGKYPSVERDGKLVDNGDGTYEYTFKLDIKTVKGLADALVDSGDKRKADLGDLSYDPNLTHRLVVAVSSRLANTDWADALKTPYERVIDFIPATGKVVTDADSRRDIVTKESCYECHSGTTRFAAHHATRQDPRYCVVCHNEQIKYGLKEAAVDANGNYDGKNTNIINGFAVGSFTTFIHKIHMGTKLSKTGYNFEDAAVNVPAMNFEKVKYPQDIRNCAKCHSKGAATPQGDNWTTTPSRATCGSCHDGINWATGAGHVGGSASSDQACALCHKAADIVNVHPAKLPATTDATKRTMQSTITSVKIDDVTGKVTAFFTVTNNDQPVTTLEGFVDKTSGGGPYPQFTLVKLVKGANGATKWVSYTNRFRTKQAGSAPVLQATADTAGTYAIVDAAKGQFSYTFELNNSSVPGNIKMPLTTANVDPRSTSVGYSGAMTLPLPAAYAANFTTFDATKTHRVTMALAGAKMKKAAFLDFVPNGAKVTETRNIVSMDTCNKCHAGKLMHRGYDIELCVTCHTADTSDNGNYNGSAVNDSASFEYVIHKIHQNTSSPGSYILNQVQFGGVVFPANANNCQACHVEGTGAPANAANWRTTPTANACITCHDGSHAQAHANLNVNACMTCHSSGRSAAADVAHQ
ncbi:OmcA/MtrC family decaheme c-type cytochrome [Trichlorobacter ammonificans]|uniref:MULTIHEME_CYTC domain-containing protein n=1 Tax=Trichlorobacter ammonificans TaxID=2916410 RepID=A0ABM9D9N9_9BACT|nr:OmcA/MtrC family decaheme c-type cytochrome [Trichlorobacter ammonificans]CAH2031934.1 MULTIHEME_CYTC domain-containing protein [Trichlorobacter ammonificans]